MRNEINDFSEVRVNKCYLRMRLFQLLIISELWPVEANLRTLYVKNIQESHRKARMSYAKANLLPKKITARKWLLGFGCEVNGDCDSSVGWEIGSALGQKSLIVVCGVSSTCRQKDATRLKRWPVWIYHQQEPGTFKLLELRVQFINVLKYVLSVE